MGLKNQLTKTPYLVLFIVLISIGVGTASALVTITLSGNVIVTGDLDVQGDITSPTVSGLQDQISNLQTSLCSEEICDEIDNDCDGTVDEGVCEPTLLQNLTCSSDLISEGLDITSISTLGGTCLGSECYSCGVPFSNIEQTGAENVYSFVCQTSGNVQINLSNLNCDIDLYVLEDSLDPFNACSEGNSSVGTSDDTVTFSCNVGTTYYIVIEENTCEVSASFDLSFEVGQTFACKEHCSNALDDDVDGDIDCDDAECSLDPACSS